ncbi:hypothetical protein HOG47_03085 [archaeon]|nr:hypothetical protein [archaeon]
MEEDKKTILYQDLRSTIDEKTGEVIETATDRIVKIPQTPDFVMAFTKDLGYLASLSGGASKLLFGLMSVVDRENEITLNASRKRRLAETTGLKIGSIDSTLHQLKKKKLLLTVDKGIFKLNPYFFGKGKWKNVQKMRMSIEYNFETQTKSVDFETQYGIDEEEVNLLDYADEEQPFINNP